jgi:hypothetical protein
VAGKFAELIFNLDELGSADWEDGKGKKLITPAGVHKEDVHHTVSRRQRHITLLACVSAAGDTLTPMPMTRNPIRDCLWSHGLRQNEDEDVMVRQRNPAYIGEQLFFEYISNVLIPYVSSVRSRQELADEPAVLLMDPALPHTAERVLQILRQNKIIALTFPEHTTNLFLAVDLVFFGSRKHLKATAAGEFGDDWVNEQITKMIQAYQQTATLGTIR